MAIKKIHYGPAIEAQQVPCWRSGFRYAEVPTVDDPLLVTCGKCARFIERHNLRAKTALELEAPPTIPATATPAPDGGQYLTAKCPVCGTVLHHSGSGGHRVSHCPCWKERGYFIEPDTAKARRP